MIWLHRYVFRLLLPHVDREEEHNDEVDDHGERDDARDDADLIGAAVSHHLGRCRGVEQARGPHQRHVREQEHHDEVDKDEEAVLLNL